MTQENNQLNSPKWAGGIFGAVMFITIGIASLLMGIFGEENPMFPNFIGLIIGSCSLAFGILFGLLAWVQYRGINRQNSSIMTNNSDNAKTASDSKLARLTEIDTLLSKNLITKEEYDKMRQQVLFGDK
jgi:hypothetical protein